MLKNFLKANIPNIYYHHMYTLYLFFMRLQALQYKGSRFECVCCGARLSRFLFYAKQSIPANLQCPRCRLLSRHRLLWLFLQQKTNFFTQQLRVMHVAPEAMLQLAFKRLPNLDYLSVDLSSPLAMIKVDITNMQLQDETFDVVLCNHVLEHIPDDRRAMREIYRVLKPSGWAVLQVPILRQKTFEDMLIIEPKEKEKYFGLSDHVRIYGLDYDDRLREAGFEVLVDNFVQSLGTEKIERFGLDPNEKIHFCRKPDSKHCNQTKLS